eukprot:scaffold125565_cov27-Phaeocystis_antarctica.AAC.1
MQWRSPLCSAPIPRLLVGDGAEGHLVEVDVGLAQLLLHHLLGVDQRDEGGHLVRVKGQGEGWGWG